MKISTTRCKKFGHQEFVLEADESSVPDIYLREMADTIERMVEEGECFSLGQTFQIGWMITQVEAYDATQLTLVEPDMEAFPIKWIPGITHTLRHKMLQVFMLDSVSLRYQMQIPTILQSLIACNKYSSPNFLMVRSDPTNERDSGWFVGCLDKNHDHNDTAHLHCISLYEAYLNQRGIHGFVAFPTGIMIVMDQKRGLSIVNDKDEPLAVQPASFLDDWFKQHRVE